MRGGLYYSYYFNDREVLAKDSGIISNRPYSMTFLYYMQGTIVAMAAKMPDNRIWSISVQKLSTNRDSIIPYKDRQGTKTHVHGYEGVN